jgi:hypothetical protein
VTSNIDILSISVTHQTSNLACPFTPLSITSLFWEETFSVILLRITTAASCQLPRTNHSPSHDYELNSHPSYQSSHWIYMELDATGSFINQKKPKMCLHFGLGYCFHVFPFSIETNVLLVVNRGNMVFFILFIGYC